jgi:hypothetical protein
MKIQASVVQMQVRQQFTCIQQRHESLEVWTSDRTNNETKQREDNMMHAVKHAKHLDPAIESEQAHLESVKMARFQFALLQAIIERLTGKTIDVYDAEELSANIEKIESGNSKIAQLKPNQNAASNTAAGYGLIYRNESSYYEAEKIDFSMQAKVITRDGTEIDIDIEVQMSRELLLTEEVEIRDGDAKVIDPLVINFDGLGVELGQRQFNFDLDFDGERDQIAFTRQGSGFLAMDHNDNGYIDDGSELFGPETGSGFDELAEYDDDTNMFIDEADEVYGKLKVWTKDLQGNDYLLALGEAGIDAIYLGHVDTSLKLVDEKETVVGQLTGSSFFIDDNGEAGLIQEIDLHA